MTNSGEVDSGKTIKECCCMLLMGAIHHEGIIMVYSSSQNITTTPSYKRQVWPGK